MRLQGIIALLLLALVPTSSSNGDQSTNTLPFSVPSLNNETEDSFAQLNSTEISTTQGEAEATPTAPTVDRPVDNSTVVNPVLEEGPTSEQGNEIEYSTTHNTLELTTYREDAEEVKNDEIASSQVDNVQAEPSRSRDVESQPHSAESPPAQATNSSDLDKYSADELEIKLNEAKKALETAKNVTTKAREDLAKSEKAAEQPNQDYAEKKKKWEELEAVAVEKETADREYEEAQANFVDYLPTFTGAETDLESAKKELENLEKLEKELPDWPRLKLEAENKEQSKKTDEQSLKTKVLSLQSTVNTKEREFTAAEKKVNVTKKNYDANNCDDPAQTSSTRCNGLRNEILDLKGKADLAKSACDLATSNLKSAESKLTDLRKEIFDLRAEINRLNSNILDLTVKFISEKIESLKTELEGKSEIYNNAKKKKEDAEAELEKKKTAKETAEQSDGGISAETARKDAIDAKADLREANTAKDEADEKVEAQKKILENAEQKEAAEKANVEKLEQKYAEARKKEEPQTGSSPLLGVGLGIGGLMLLIGAVIGGFFLYRHLKKKGNGPDDKKKPKKGDAKSRTPSTQTSKGPEGQQLVSSTQKTSATPAAENATTPAGPPVTPVDPAARAAPPTPATAAAPAAVPFQDPAHVPIFAAVQVDGCSTLQMVDTTKIYPKGEEPFKIPAKNFKWMGRNVSKSRWHGEPKHLLEGKKGPEKLDKIWFDPNANTATEIGNDIIEDGGPASDSSRSEYLDYQDDWEKGRAAMLAAEAAEAIPNKTRSQKEDAKRKWRAFFKLDREVQKKKKEHSKQGRDEAAGRKKPGKDKKSNKKSKGSHSK